MSEQQENTAATETATEKTEVQSANDASWIKPRLEREAAAAEARILKSLGVSSVDEAKAKFADAQKVLDAQLSEQERQNKRLAELEPTAARVGALEATVREYADRELAGLTDLQRASVASLAGDDPAKILKALEVLRPTWAAAKPPEAPQQKPDTTSAAAPTPPAAKREHVDHKAVFAELQKSNPFAAAQYIQRHARAIVG